MASSAKAPSRLISDGYEPVFIYGTAWKKDRTKDLVKEALSAGFRKIDTAAQPRHYQEHLVGEGIRESIKEGIVTRKNLHIQTKYTTPAGQDLNNMPYHPLDPLETQIHTSIASSLKNLRPQEDSKEGSYLDCLLLHSPLPTIEQTLQAWSILETYVPNKIRALGISNVSLPVLQTIYDSAKVKPSVVQNRFYPATKYDVPLRTFCSQHNISYQSFWTLTGNPELLKSKPVASVASLTGSYHGLLELASQGASVDASVALYALVLDLGITVLNGTTSSEHMEADLRGVRKVQEWAVVNKQEWAQARKTFQQLVEPYK